MSLLLCNSCLGWVELNHTRCPRCRHQVDLQQPEPTRQQLVQRMGTAELVLGSVQLLRFDPPAVGILYATTRGLLLGPVFSEVQTGEICDALPAEPGRLRMLASAVFPLESLLRAIPGRTRESEALQPLPDSPHVSDADSRQLNPSVADATTVQLPDKTPAAGAAAPPPQIPDPVTTLMSDPRSLFVDQQRIAKLQLRRRQCQIHLWTQAPLRLTILTEAAVFRQGLERLEELSGWQGLLDY